MAEKTSGEQLLEIYLRERAWTWEYERPTETTQPDYVVRMPCGEVVCEVKDFAWTEDDERIMQAPGGVEPYRRIREKVNQASKQMRPYKGEGVPCVLVLHNDASLTITLDAFHVFGALFGDMGIEVELKPPYNTKPYVEAAKAKLRHSQNTTISAVAVLDRFAPHQRLLHEAAAKEPYEPEKGDDTRALIERVLRAFERVRAQHPDLDFDATVPRMRVMKNPYAAVPLPDDVFNGPHDGALELEP